VEIVVDDLTGPQIARFLDEHVAEMLSITPPESKHASGRGNHVVSPGGRGHRAGARETESDGWC
jgi:hypothetical protein